MWLAKELTRLRAEEEAEIESGVVTLAQERLGVFASGEVRGAEIAGPGGFVWRPRGGERVVLLKSGAPGGESFVLGVPGQETGGLAPGEVCLRAGEAQLVLHTDGRIELTGRLVVNGTEIGGTQSGA